MDDISKEKQVALRSAESLWLEYFGDIEFPDWKKKEDERKERERINIEKVCEQGW